MKTFILVTSVAAALIVLLNLALAEESTTTPQPNRYMGVDANDIEAVRNKQKELGHDKWVELFGHGNDLPSDMFSPDFDSGIMTDTRAKLRGALTQLLDLVNKAFSKKHDVPEAKTAQPDQKEE